MVTGMLGLALEVSKCELQHPRLRPAAGLLLLLLLLLLACLLPQSWASGEWGVFHRQLPTVRRATVEGG